MVDPLLYPSAVTNPRRRWIGGTTDWRVEIGILTDSEVGSAWDIGLWDEGVWAGFLRNWYDVTRWVLDVQTSRGRSKFLERMRTGSARIVLDNTDGFWNPYSGELPNTLRLRPGRFVRVSAYAEGVGLDGYVPVFVGTVDRIDDQYRSGAYDAQTVLEVLDPAALFQVDNPPALETERPSELTSERVAYELDEWGWPDDPSWRDIQTGVVPMRASTLGQSRLEEIQRAADAEGSAFYFDGSGRAVFKRRQWLRNDPRSTTVQAVLGGPTGLPIVDADPEWGASEIVNDVQFSRVEGTAIRATDTASQALYGPRTLRRFDLQCQNDADVQFLADAAIDAFAYDRLRLNAVTVAPLNATQAAQCLDLRIGDLVRVQVRVGGFRWSYTTEAHVQGIAHQVDADDWTVTYRLDDTQRGPSDGSAFTNGFSQGFTAPPPDTP